MQCDYVREFMSAYLDGELDESQAIPHLAHIETCAGCSAWMQSAKSLHQATRLTIADEVPDLTDLITANASVKSHVELVQVLRAGLLLVGVLQIISGVVSAAMASVNGEPLHLAHELGVWDIALAIGFCAAAHKPERAWGMLPVAAAVGIGLITTGLMDSADGVTPILGESGHLMEVFGFAFLWLLARVTSSKGQRLMLSSARL